MHKYLSTVGFSDVLLRKEVADLLTEVVEQNDEKVVAQDYIDGEIINFVEFTKYYGKDIGVSVCGQYDSDSKFYVESYYPFYRGHKITTTLPLSVDQHYDRTAFSGACDDLRVGITLIFFLQKPAEYINNWQKLGKLEDHVPVKITGLASSGCILLPLEKDSDEILVEKEITKNRNELMAAAMDGDEEAMESLNKDDMETYSIISERIQNEDLYSIVDSYFMPYGILCDQYNLMGEIKNFDYFTNTNTGEEILHLELECNDIELDIIINENELMGEPRVGRRFKGIIWLQGCIDYDKYEENKKNEPEEPNN